MHSNYSVTQQGPTLLLKIHQYSAMQSNAVALQQQLHLKRLVLVCGQPNNDS